MSDSRYDAVSHYDRVTPAWTLLLGDDLHYGVFADADDDLPSATRRLTRLMADAARVADGVRVLDVGCGTGAPACELARVYGARVTGITTSPVGVDAARARAREHGVEHLVTFDCRDGTDNRFAAGSFDCIWVLESAHLVRQRERLLAECVRVLRPGGRFALCDVVLRRPMPFDEVRRRRHELALLRGVFGDARLEVIAWYAEALGAHGLTTEAEIDLSDATRPTFARWRANASRHRDDVISMLGAEDWQRFVDACDLLERLWDEGALGYALLAASKPG